MIHISRQDAFTACSSQRFADQLASASPYASPDALLTAARRIWWQEVGVPGWLEAFAAHPKIGDAAALRSRFSGSAFGAHSHSEQATALSTSDSAVFEELARLNAEYEARFGHIFIIYAAGKSAQEMLAALTARIRRTPLEELTTAACEQMKITEQRLLKLVAAGPQGAAAPGPSSSDSSTSSSRAAARTSQLADHLGAAAFPSQQQQQQHQQQAHGGALRSPITTHVLDTTLGAPAAGLSITLQRLMQGSTGVWDTVAAGVTNSDGRISDLLTPGSRVQAGTYRMLFATGSYLRACHARHPSVFAAEPFYPAAAVEFTVTPEIAGQHFHIPLSLSPYAYSTYRGS